MEDQTKKQISDACDRLKSVLLAKNDAYGNGVFNSPVLFTNASPEDAVAVRASDKIARLKTLFNMRSADETLVETFDDTLLDLAGYCLLWLIIRDRVNERDE